MSLISFPLSLPTLGERLHDALAVTPTLIADVVREACRRFPSQGQAGKTERIGQLINMGSGIDASLALIALELPRWQVRRLVYDSGEWHCALSRDRELPDWLSDLSLPRPTFAIASHFRQTNFPMSPSGGQGKMDLATQGDRSDEQR